MEEPPLGSEWREKRERVGIGSRARGLAEGAASQLESGELGSEQREKREEEAAIPGGAWTGGGAERGLLGSEARGSEGREPATGNEGPAGGLELGSEQRGKRGAAGSAGPAGGVE